MGHNKVTLVIRGVEVEHRLNYNAGTQAKWRECVVKLETMLEHWDALAKYIIECVERDIANAKAYHGTASLGFSIGELYV